MEEFTMVDEVKPKSIIINGNLHNKFKKMCNGKNMKIGGIVEDLIKLYLNNPKDVQKMIDNSNTNQ